MPDQIPPNLMIYLCELEGLNEHFLKSLKECLRVFTEIGPLVPNPAGWQDMLKDIQNVIEVGDRLYDQRKPG